MSSAFLTSQKLLVTIHIGFPTEGMMMQAMDGDMRSGGGDDLIAAGIACLPHHQADHGANPTGSVKEERYHKTIHALKKTHLADIPHPVVLSLSDSARLLASRWPELVAQRKRSAQGAGSIPLGVAGLVEGGTSSATRYGRLV